MAAIVVLPGIALVGILGEGALKDPDAAFPYLVNTYLPVGLKGLILCALFASLGSTVDSTFNSLATLWSIDIHKPNINKNATDRQVVQSRRNAILVGFVVIYLGQKEDSQKTNSTLNSTPRLSEKWELPCCFL